MFLHRRLLYHRGIDDSIGTYVSDYVLFVACAILAIFLIAQIIKFMNIPKQSSGVRKSTYAIAALFVFVGLAAFVGGLAHQYVQMIEPYPDWRGSMGWVVAWRLAASTSAGISFTFLLLAQHLLCSENLLQPSRAAYIVYYMVVGFICSGIFIHSMWMITHQTDPWSLTITFAVVFACCLFQGIISLVVVCKRFRHQTIASNDMSSETSSDTLSLANFPENGEKPKPKGYQQKSIETLNNNTTTVYRWDLLLHSFAPTLFLLGGLVQTLLKVAGKCGNDDNECILPEAFNHNGLLHLIHFFSMITYFAAEYLALRHRRRNDRLWNDSCHKNINDV